MLLLYSSFASGGSFRQASRRICNPALKNVLTYFGSADLQSAAKEYALPFIGGLQIPRCYRSNLFLRRISNPPGRLAGDSSSGRLAGDCSFLPLGVSTDLQSVVKKCPNLFVFWGFVIPSHQYCHSDEFVIPSYQYCHSDGFAIPINK